MKSQSCCFTGHRDVPAFLSPLLYDMLIDEMIVLLRRGICNYYTGGALGFDTLAAKCVQELREVYTEIKHILALPCPEQADRWREYDKAQYEKIRQRANEVVYVSNRYTPDCMQKRNRYMADHSCCCLCYLTQSSGGTKRTVDYCMKKGVEVRNIADRIPIQRV